MVDCDIVTLPYELEFVSAIPNILDDPIIDTFTRTVSNGWGTADTGQSWANSGGSAGDYSVASGVGRHSLGVVNSARSNRLAVTMPDVDITGTVTPSATAAGAAIRGGFLVRRSSDGSTHYRFEVRFEPAGTVTAAIARLGGPSADLTTGAVPGSHAAGVTWHIRGQAIGALLRMRAWQAGTEEPTTWQLSTTDTVHTTGGIGTRSDLATGNTNTLPVTVSFDDLQARPAVGTIQTSDPEVLLSLHTSPWCVSEGTRFDPPAPRYAEVASMLADGSRYPSIVYNNRVLELRLAVQAANPDELASALQNLARQLHFGLDGTGRNIIRFADKTTESVYFRTFRVSPTDIGIIARSQRTAVVAVDIPAEPYAYGPREFYEAITVTNNPATGVANPMYFDLQDVKGDVDTPLMLMTTGHAVGPVSVIAVRRRGNPDDMPFALQAELADTLANSTTLQAFDATFSGSGSNRTRTDLTASPAQAERIQYVNLPDTRTVDGRGDYRVIVRLKRSVSGLSATVLANAGVSGASSFIRTDQVEVAQSDGFQLIDLGVISVPIGADPVFDGYSGQQIPVYGQNFFVELECTTTPANCGTVDLDYVLLTPADDSWLAVRWANSGIGNAAENVIDSIHESVWFRDDHGALLSSDPTPVVGGFPYVSPEQTNRIVTVMFVGDSSDDITDQIVFLPSYWPRYLDPVRPVTE